jgi:hypothetical protein
MKWLNRLREGLCHFLCPDLLFNRDMSLEIDRLLQRIQELEERDDFS